MASIKQMKLFLFKKGYYDAIDTFELSRPFLSKRKIKIHYKISPNTAYRINKLEYN